MKKQITLCILLVTIVLTLSSCKSSKYNKAEKLFSQGNYAAARELYQKLENDGGYEDSADKVLESDYYLAESAFTQGNYADAIKQFHALENYKDSADKLLEAKYLLAGKHVEEAKFTDAIRLYGELNNYKDSPSLAYLCSMQMLQIASVGDYVYLGRYKPNNAISGSIEEPICWLVLSKSDDELLLISRYILEKIRFGTNYKWETSELRQWLNDDFITNAFNDSERQYIQPMITSENTTDSIFCLSADEARELFSGDKDRAAVVSPALINAGFKTNPYCGDKNRGDWWTRSVSKASNGPGVVNVEPDGEVRSAGIIQYTADGYFNDIGVRPSLCFNLAGATKDPHNMNIFGASDSSGDLDHEVLKTRKSSASTKKCTVCNGSGYVKYNYGDSDLEAYLTGHDPYTVRVCPSCKGTGRE